MSNLYFLVMKNLIVILFLTGFLVSSCQKQPVSPYTPETPVTGMNNLVASQSFDWKIIKQVTIDISGFSSQVPITNTLKVSDESGNVYLSTKTFMSEDVSYEISIPSYLTTLIVSFGTVSKTLDISNGRVLFDYVIPVPEADITL